MEIPGIAWSEKPCNNRQWGFWKSADVREWWFWGFSAGYGKSYLFHMVFKLPAAVGNLMFSFDKLVQKINVFLTVKVCCVF